MSNQDGIIKTQEIRGPEDHNVETYQRKLRQMEDNISYLDREIADLKERLTTAERNIAALESA